MNIKQNKLVISLIIFVIWVMILVVIPKLLIGPETESIDASVSKVNIPLLLAPLFLFVAVIILGWRREVGLRPPDSVKSLLVLWLPILFVLSFFVVALLLGLSLTQTVGFILFNTILVGISEELMFRGIILHGALSHLRIWTAILFTTVLFGSVHILNGFTTGNFRAAAIQATTAAMTGLCFLAIRLRTKSIFPAMLIHALWDCGLFLMSTASKTNDSSQTEISSNVSSIGSLIFPILFALPNFLYGIWLLRNIEGKSSEEILKE